MKRLLSLLVAISALSSSIAQVKTNFTKQNYDKFFIKEAIPSDIKEDKYVLLVNSPFTEDKTEKNQAIKEIFDSLYKGKFVVIPAESKDFTTYKNKNIYRYCIAMTDVAGGKRVGDKAFHGRYRVDIIDLLKIYKGDADPEAVLDKITNGGKKKAKLEDLKKEIRMEDFDLTAIHETGLEDEDGKLNNMLAYLANKLNEFKK